MSQQEISHCLLSQQLIQHPVVVASVQPHHQQVLHHQVVAESVLAVQTALKSETVVFWEQLSQTVFEMDVSGAHQVFKENHGVFTNQEAAQQLNRLLVAHLAM